MSDITNHQQPDTLQDEKLVSPSLPGSPLSTAGVSHSIPPSFDDTQLALEQLAHETASRLAWESAIRRKRRRLRTCLILFLLTFSSTTLIGAEYWPLDILPGFFNAASKAKILSHLNIIWPSINGMEMTLLDRFWQSIKLGLTYSCPLMLILLCHEMGHYLQAVRYRVPASLPYFIPLPLPPLGTMGAVIMQGRGFADRRKMFDIAVSGPLAGLAVTFPILFFGIKSSQYAFPSDGIGFEFGQPILVRWLIDLIHGPAPAGMVFDWNGYATAGWVGVFITAMNLLPIGQLDGGHLMYTLIGRPAHWIAWGLILVAVAAMIYAEQHSYILLLILLTLTGPRHPPTADDTVAIGWVRHVIGWITLSFLLVGFTPQPIVISERRPEPPVSSNVLKAIEDQDWFDWESLNSSRD